MAPAAIMAMPGATVVITTPAMAIVAVVTVPAAVIAAVLPFAVAALLAPARIGTRRPGMPVRRRVAQEVHRDRSHGASRTDRKSTRLNSSHTVISYAVFCLRSEEHTSELQSHSDLVCRLLL